MRTLAAIVVLILLASISQLSAQSGGSGSGSTGSQMMKLPVGAGEKVPAHQQPRASDAPAAPTMTDQQLSAEDKALDRKLKAICRGC
jgi:hypothetical protein